jgi:hypothetical protein
MRRTLLAIVFAFPAAALAQTPRDIAAQLWPYGVTGHTAQAPTQAAIGTFTARDVAAQVWPYGAPAARNTAPAGGAALATGMTGADLARLLGGQSLSNGANRPIRIVRDDRPHG